MYKEKEEEERREKLGLPKDRNLLIDAAPPPQISERIKPDIQSFRHVRNKNHPYHFNLFSFSTIKQLTNKYTNGIQEDTTSFPNNSPSNGVTSPPHNPPALPPISPDLQHQQHVNELQALVQNARISDNNPPVLAEYPGMPLMLNSTTPAPDPSTFYNPNLFFPTTPTFLMQDPNTGMFVPVPFIPGQTLPSPIPLLPSSNITSDSNGNNSNHSGTSAQVSSTANTNHRTDINSVSPPTTPKTTPTTNPPVSSTSNSISSTSSTSSSNHSSTSKRPPKKRRLIVDGELFQAFMRAVEPNTKRNIETCGILAGKLSANVLHITHCILPKQTGTSDTCAMTHEDELLLYCAEHDLLTFGWIHTHPQHDLFLSSVDMHTHSAYQSLLDEAVAVVVAPLRKPNFGIFGLTETGLVAIQRCPLRGFHPHDKWGLYNTCEHVTMRWSSGAKFQLVDLRK